MMENLLRRGNELAVRGQQKKLSDVAQQLRNIFTGTAVRVEDAQVLVSGRGIIKRWLLDPTLRFLVGDLK